MELLIDEASSLSRSPLTLVLAHGAGGGMRTRFLQTLASGLAGRGLRIVRFEFPYWTAGKRVPDREPVLLDAWREVVSSLGPSHDLIIGGKSMGGRMASRVASELDVRGLVCLGYPFHPPGQPEKLRTAHLSGISVPTLFVQGERDAFGNRAEVATYDLPASIRFEWIVDGDHSFKPRVASGSTEKDNLEAAEAAVWKFAIEL